MLTLFNVTEAQSGEYVCKVSNYIGEANQSAWLTVTRPVAKGNGEMDGAVCWEFDFGPKLLGQVGKPAPNSPCYPAVFLVPRAMEKYPAWEAGLVRYCVGICFLCAFCVFPGCVCSREDSLALLWLILQTGCEKGPGVPV